MKDNYPIYIIIGMILLACFLYGLSQFLLERDNQIATKKMSVRSFEMKGFDYLDKPISSAAFSQENDFGLVIHTGSYTPPEKNPYRNVQTEKLTKIKLGKFEKESKDGRIHYISMEIEVGFYEKQVENLKQYKNLMKRIIEEIISISPIDVTVEGYWDSKLHLKIQESLQNFLDENKLENYKIQEICIPEFFAK